MKRESEIRYADEEIKRRTAKVLGMQGALPSKHFIKAEEKNAPYVHLSSLFLAMAVKPGISQKFLEKGSRVLNDVLQETS